MMEFILDNHMANIPQLNKYTVVCVPYNWCLLDITLMILKVIHRFKKNNILWPLKPAYHQDWLFYPNWFKTIQYKYNNIILDTNKPFIFYKSIKCFKITINYNEITCPILTDDLVNNINYYKFISMAKPSLPLDIVEFILSFILYI